MFKIVNSKTNKAVKDAISGKVIYFDVKEHAETFASSMKRNSITQGTAWNRVRPTSYVVCAA